MEEEDMVCIGVIGAMEEEVASLINQMEDAESKTMAGMTFNKGKLWNQDAVVVHFRHVFCTSNTRQKAGGSSCTMLSSPMMGRRPSFMNTGMPSA